MELAFPNQTTMLSLGSLLGSTTENAGPDIVRPSPLVLHTICL